MNRIRVLREESKMTQRDLASRLGVEPAVVSKYENEKSGLSEGTLRMLALIFDVSVDYILGLSDERKKGTTYSVPHIAALLGSAGNLPEEDCKALVICSTHPDALAVARQFISLSSKSRRRALEYLDMLKLSDRERRQAKEAAGSSDDEEGAASADVQRTEE